jgi:putative membrane protein
VAEPDYRFTLANERTYLAWLRTALALLGGAVAVSQLIDRSGLAWLRIGLGVALVLLGLVVSVMSVWRWHAAEAAIRAGGPLPRLRLPWLVSAGVTVIALLVLALVLSGTRP